MTGQPFYVGYVARSAEGVARFIRPRLTLLAVSLAVLAVLAATAGAPLGNGRFEYGTVRSFEGRIIEAPYPTLAVHRGADAHAAWSYHLLAGPGKHGAGAEVAGLDGKTVRLTGTAAHRDGETLIEVAARPETLAPDPEPLDSLIALGGVTLTGEIVDGKCHLGVMVPGEGPTHRGCAVRCISGGAPALFVAHDSAGTAFRFLLVDSSLAPVGRRVLDVVAAPLRITGQAFRRGDLYYLAAEPSTYQRLP
jgi:hypothetical protein